MVLHKSQYYQKDLQHNYSFADLLSFSPPSFASAFPGFLTSSLNSLILVPKALPKPESLLEPKTKIAIAKINKISVGRLYNQLEQKIK